MVYYFISKIPTVNDIRLSATEFIRQFIDLYKSMPSLWQLKSAEYMDRGKKDSAYKELLQLCQSVCPEAILNTVKTKIANLRTVYRKETKKIKDAQKSGAGVNDLYVPKFWYFELLHFIKNHEEPRSSSFSLDLEAVKSGGRYDQIVSSVAHDRYDCMRSNRFNLFRLYRQWPA